MGIILLRSDYMSNNKYSKNYKEYLSMLPLVSIFVSLVQYIGIFYFSNSGEKEALTRSLLFGLAFFLVSFLLGRLITKKPLETIRAKKLTLVLLLLYIVLNLINLLA